MKVLGQVWAFSFSEGVVIAARTSIVVAFDGAAFVEYFGFEADVVVEHDLALNATGMNCVLIRRCKMPRSK